MFRSNPNHHENPEGNSRITKHLWHTGKHRCCCRQRVNSRSLSFGDGRSRFTSSTFNFASSSAHHPLMNSEQLCRSFRTFFQDPPCFSFK
ncbi:hypothetical protein AVEN_19011-1 [Araneus ventricosus]|uniref:Uncharacterized protein n=1 Tax=Araneus ventricosus TaxID=182803 RepID=A0A4Y2KKY6_ARAVE|nr:hypothetical protein AVEN_19011-1 [Araneus ventricosus]